MKALIVTALLLTSATPDSSLTLDNIQSEYVKASRQFLSHSDSNTESIAKNAMTFDPKLHGDRDHFDTLQVWVVQYCGPYHREWVRDPGDNMEAMRFAVCVVVAAKSYIAGFSDARFDM